MKKLFFLGAVALGYVLGAKAGRERYEQIMRATKQVKENPTVQKTAHQAADLAKDAATQAAGVAKDKASSAAATVSDKVHPSGKKDDLTDQLHPKSTARQDNPYPQGDLP